MRILIISNFFPPGFIGGYELMALEVADGLAARGHQVEVLTSDHFVDDDAAIPYRVDRVLRYGVLNRVPHESATLEVDHAFSIPGNTRKLASALVRFRPDRVLCFNMTFIGAPALVALMVGLGIRPVLYFAGEVFDGYAGLPDARWRFERVFGPPDWIDGVACVFMSGLLHRGVQTIFRRRIAPAAVIPAWFGTADPPERAPREPGPVRFVFASRIYALKGVDTLLDAARMVAADGVPFTLDVFGDGEVAAMLQRIHALGLTGHVRYRGTLSKAALLRSYTGFDALLFPTWAGEPFGSVAVEAAAAGCIPVMTAGIGASEWFLDGVDSFKIAGTPAGLAAAMRAVLGMDDGARAAMGDAARRTALRFFRFPAVLGQLEAVLDAAGPAPVPDRGRVRATEAALEVLTDVWKRAG